MKVQLLHLLPLFLSLSACDPDDPPKGDDYDGDGVPADEDCDDSDPDVLGPADWYVDRDGDGFGDPETLLSGCIHVEGSINVGGDCDDANPEVHPDADEICNGVDDDCNGRRDDRRWYLDLDGDGYGDPTTAVTNCLPIPGMVGDASDCDDTNARIHPGAEERCDDVDQDCDGEIDEDAVNPRTWYRDADGDLYGDLTDTMVGCDPDPGYVADNRDCDDTNIYIRPYGREIPGDGIDSDCSGGESCYNDLDGDGFGGAQARESADMDCDDPGETLDHSDCDDWNAMVKPGAVELCNQIDDDCDGETDEDDAEGTVTWYRDADNDHHGNPELTYVACWQPRGWVAEADADDCDDTQRTVYPGAPELCDELDNNCDGVYDDVVWYRDADEDGYGDPADTWIGCPAAEGYVDNDMDCDDTTIRIRPGAAEVMLDGIDQDCDGGDLCYLDHDRDGYGSTTRRASEDLDCTDEGESVLNTDCDDTDPYVLPGAEELCNGVDDDCDGETDEGSPPDATAWHPDLDRDGYGDASTTVWACSAPRRYRADASDCDDSDAAVNPAGTEACNGYDDNCDGRVDDVTWYLDRDGDGWGVAEVSRVVCPGPTGYATQVGDCDDDDPEVSPGTAEVCGDGIDNDCNGHSWGCGIWGDVDLDEADAVFQGSLSCDDEHASLDVAAAGDLNLDGYDDILLGLNADSCMDDPGAVYVFLGPVYGDTDLSSADLVLLGTTAGDQAGSAVRSAGDFNRDGYPDLLVGAYGEDSGGSWAGMVYLVLGPATGSRNLSSADARYYGGFAGAWAGWAVDGAGDVNDDGYDDLIIGSPHMSEGARWRGAAYIVRGPTASTLELSGADTVLTGVTEQDFAGWSVAGAGDIDADGRADVLVGALRHNGSGTRVGAAYLVLAPDIDLTLSSADAIFYGAADGDAAGSSLDGGGDVNGDGYDDLLIGAYRQDQGGYEAGAVYVVFGPVSGSMTLDAADAMLYGETLADHAGASVAGLGDLDNDGFDDLLVGASRAGSSASGIAYLVMGPVSGSVSLADAGARLLGPIEGDRAGTSVAGAGDVDGNGFGDLLVGGSPSTGGIAWLLYNEVRP